MLDYLDDIEFDMLRSLGIKNPMKLSSSRYFKTVERLVYVDGVVRAKLLQVAQEQNVLPGQQMQMQQQAQPAQSPVSLETFLHQKDDMGRGLADLFEL